jgi:hypothetical protein
MRTKPQHTDEEFITRPALAVRWDVHPETIKRDERKGLLTPYYFSTRRVRYKMSEVLALEHAAVKRGAPEQKGVRIPGRFFKAAESFQEVKR